MQIDQTQIYRNELEIRAIGLQRSGNHAVLHWICEQFRGRSVVFLNNVRHGNFDPFVSASSVESFGQASEVDLSDLAVMQKRLLIYSYEDDLGKCVNLRNLLKSMDDLEYEQNRIRYVGVSKARVDFIILRDAFNFFASRLKKLDQLSGDRDLGNIVENWKLLACQIVKLGNNDASQLGWINFNRWYLSREYRRRLCGEIAGNFSDRSLDEVPRYGGGSSFDGRAKSKKSRLMLLKRWRSALVAGNLRKYPMYFRALCGMQTREMNVLERWRVMESDEVFRDVFRDKELVELSRVLFGEIPGTLDFLNQIAR